MAVLIEETKEIVEVSPRGAPPGVVAFSAHPRLVGGEDLREQQHLGAGVAGLVDHCGEGPACGAVGYSGVSAVVAGRSGDGHRE